MDPLCYLYFVSVILSFLFIAAMWSPAGKGLTSWLSSVMFPCVGWVMSITFYSYFEHRLLINKF